MGLTKEEQSLLAWAVVLALFALWQVGIYVRAERRRDRSKLDIKPAFENDKKAGK